ncbi:hypothetical protein HMPREF9057_01502 [Actinomyces sp. oral taxon 171 str. F0337]|nr:hypothetical protein HMPREF9057_01502 [Actinomyces sp. oral taxon 171 str. F0337]
MAEDRPGAGLTFPRPAPSGSRAASRRRFDIGSALGAGLEPAHSTRVGIYWPGVVRTARTPDPYGVAPTLLQ